MRHRAGFWVLLSLVALLCFLGYLQYRWIDRLAQAEHEREQQSLQNAIGQIAAAFDVEVTRAQLAFAPFPMRLDNSAYWADRAQMWHEFAPYPRLVKDVFVTEEGRTYKITASGAEPLEGLMPSGPDRLLSCLWAVRKMHPGCELWSLMATTFAMTCCQNSQPAT